ncbi:MAG: hypothetical protein RHS_1310 [Robinsoniella sp. RHS]|uniref:FAD-dependent oxidoreductase n=1 Tax=Robinsoniella sp. RHS TaxID=1504536 RepID=UPI00064B4CA2|nr:MAG: hypothetical protein RHS_1310 [Robinsoniella sp. RHS]
MEGLYDVIIVGGGPAGLSAAIYMARARYRTLIIEKEKFGGQITITSEVVNYPGIPSISGSELTEGMRMQAEAFGAEFLLANVEQLDLNEDIKRVKTDRGEKRALGIILATGASPRKIGFPGEQEFQGRGVAYCATCDGEFFTGKDVLVAGGGFAAVEEAMFLTKYARQVLILVRGESFSCAKSVSDELANYEKIKVLFHTEIKEAGGTDKLQYALLYNSQTGESTRFEPEDGSSFGIFVFAGYAPANSLFKDIVDIDEHGYLITDMNHKTSIDGVYGAGDICVKNLRQVVTAVADGAKAATSLEKYVSEVHERKNIPPIPMPLKAHTSDSASREANNHPEQEESHSDGAFIPATMRSQLKPLFEKFTRQIRLKAFLDQTPISREAEGFVQEMAELTSWIETEIIQDANIPLTPSIDLYESSGLSLGFRFHGVPGGHEFNSFIVTLYNAAGPGQMIDEQLLGRIRAISEPVKIDIAISLSCTMCPDLVMAAGRIAIENANVQCDIFDLNHFPKLKEDYQIMSVPCMIINQEHAYFGKKSIEEILGLIDENS